MSDQGDVEYLSRQFPSLSRELPRLGGQLSSRRERLGRHGRRARLYTRAILLVAALVILVLLIAASTRSVKLDWVVGSSHASLVWIISAAAVLGWLLGITTGIVFRHRTRRRV